MILLAGLLVRFSLVWCGFVGFGPLDGRLLLLFLLCWLVCCCLGCAGGWLVGWLVEWLLGVLTGWPDAVDHDASACCLISSGAELYCVFFLSSGPFFSFTVWTLCLRSAAFFCVTFRYSVGPVAADSAAVRMRGGDLRLACRCVRVLRVLV